MQIHVVPVGGVKGNILRDIISGLESLSANEFVLAEEMEPIKEAYDKFRGQYRSDMLLSYMKRALSYEKILGITTLDLFVPSLNFVFGQADLGGRACIVSLKRLDQGYYGLKEDYELFMERSLKECTHEVGHVFGLEHCRNKECVMSFSNSIIEVDRKDKYLCAECKGKLK